MFLKRIFKKPPPPESVVEKLSLEGLRERLNELRQERLSDIQSKLDSVLGRISSERKAILDELKNLYQAESSERVHPGIYKSSMEGRRLFIDKMSRALADFQSNVGNSTESMTSLDDRLAKMVNFTTETIKTHSRFVRVLFNQQMNVLQLQLRQLHNSAKEVHNLIKEAVEKARSLDAVLSKVEAQIELSCRIENMGAETKSLKEKVPQLEKIVKDEKERLERLMKSEEFGQIGSLGHEIKQVEDKISNVKNSITSELSSLSRPLRKMEKLVNSEKYQLERDLFFVLKLCTQDPLEVIATNEKITATESVLKKLLTLLEEGKIELSDKERSKRMETAREIVEKAKLKKYKEQLEHLQNEREERLRVWEKLPHMRKSEIEHSIQKNQSELDSVRATIEELGQKSKAAAEEVERNRPELEKLASGITGTRVLITS